MRYALARDAKRQREEAYQIYITDSLYLQAQGKGFAKRYIELIQPKIMDQRSGEEIAADVINKLQLEVL